MDNYTTFKVIAEGPNGAHAKFTLYDQDATPRPARGTTHNAALNAEADLYNRLVQIYQGEDE